MLTRATTTSLVQNAVFNTQELLETILLHLPKPQNLLQARRVNSHWNAVILTSTPLRRKLYLTPQPTSKHTPWLFDAKKKTLRLCTPQECEMPGALWTLPATLNSIFFCVEGVGMRDGITKRVQRAEPVLLKARPDMSDASGEKKGGIFAEMLVCQPASKQVTFEWVVERVGKADVLSRSSRSGNGSGRLKKFITGKVTNESGVTFKDLMGAVRDAVKRMPGGLGTDGSEWSVVVEKSSLWLSGVVFPTEEEREGVEMGAVGGRTT